MKRLFSRIIAVFIAALIVSPLYAEGSAVRYPRLTNEEFAEIIKDKNTQLVDIRTPGEFDAGHIPGAINIDCMGNADFEKQLAKLDRSKTVALYCSSGSTCAQAANRLMQAGYKVVELRDGFERWTGESVQEAS